MVGATIRYTEMATRRTVEVCPGGACWRPVWSPDGTAIAFFSDADGLPQLWVHDVAAGMSRRLSGEPVKPKLWHGDEPRWSPDGSTLCVGFAPEGRFRNPVRPAEVRADNPAGVVVLRSGSETEAAPDADGSPPTPMTDHYAREHLVAVKAIDAVSGETRVLVPQDAEIPAGTLRLSASGRWLGYLSTFRPESDTTQSTVMDVAVVSAAGGDPIPVVRNVPLTRNDYFGGSYVWHPSDDRLMYLDEKRMHLLDLRSGSPAAPVPLAPELGDMAPTVFAFTRNGRATVMGADVVDDRNYGDPRPRALAVAPLDGGTPTTYPIDDERWRYDQLVRPTSGRRGSRTAPRSTSSSPSARRATRRSSASAPARSSPAPTSSAPQCPSPASSICSAPTGASMSTAAGSSWPGARAGRRAWDASVGGRAPLPRQLPLLQRGQDLHPGADRARHRGYGLPRCRQALQRPPTAGQAGSARFIPGSGPRHLVLEAGKRDRRGTTHGGVLPAASGRAASSPIIP